MRQKERRMHHARILAREGLKQREIADRMQVSTRMVRYYLKSDDCVKEPVKRGSKLDPYKPYLTSIIDEKPFINQKVLLKLIRNKGYNGGISILREWSASYRKSMIKKAVIRFETEPGFQAQVDWKEAGTWIQDGRKIKLYAFVMLLGYSRKVYVRFTTSMKSSVVLACHAKAFEYFNGVPHEILYDNMKTAWIYDGQNWNVNDKLLEFASCTGFIPRRCQVRRPQTKGKVERFIQTLGNQYLPLAKEEGHTTIEELNRSVFDWLDSHTGEEIRDIPGTRQSRFEFEKDYLWGFNKEALPDTREIITLMVNREGFITHETNRYSVPAEYLGCQLELKIDPLNSSMEILSGIKIIRTTALLPKGSHGRDERQEDRDSLLNLWKKQNCRQEYPTPPKAETGEPIPSRHPRYYEAFQVAV